MEEIIQEIVDELWVNDQEIAVQGGCRYSDEQEIQVKAMIRTQVEGWIERIKKELAA